MWSSVNLTMVHRLILNTVGRGVNTEYRLQPSSFTDMHACVCECV